MKFFQPFSKFRNKKKIKKIKKRNKLIDLNEQNKIINNLDFQLTSDQLKTLNEINKDLSSNSKMFRLLQGDVGSGKTIVSLLSHLIQLIQVFRSL